MSDIKFRTNQLMKIFGINNKSTTYKMSSDVKQDIYISIIIPVYETDDVVDRCFSSLAKQTYKHFEIIFVDDCSSYTQDQYRTVINKYKGRLDIKYINAGHNLGPGDAKQLGLYYAKGDFVSFLDADDCYTDTLLESVVNVIDADTMVVVSNWRSNGNSDDDINVVNTSVDGLFMFIRQGSFIRKQLINDYDILYKSCLSRKEEDSEFYNQIQSLLMFSESYRCKAIQTDAYYEHIYDAPEDGYQGASSNYDMQNSYLQVLILSIERIFNKIKFGIFDFGDLRVIDKFFKELEADINEHGYGILNDRKHIYLYEYNRLCRFMEDFNVILDSNYDKLFENMKEKTQSLILK